MKMVVLCCFLVLPSFTALAAPPQNIAPRARVTADSEHSSGFLARFVADGKVPAAGRRNGAGQEWAVQGATHRKGAALTFEWAQPETIAEIVYYGRTSYATECWKDYEIYVGGESLAIFKGQLKSGHGPQRISLPQPSRARKLKLKFTSAYDGLNPGAAEVMIFASSPPDSLIGRFKSLPPYSATTGGPDVRIPESPQLAAALKAGKLGFDKLVVVQRHEVNPSHVYTYHAESFRGGGGLYLYTPADGKLNELVASPTGEIIDVDVSFDGKEVLFSWKPSGKDQSRYGPQDFAAEGTFQVYRIGADGTGLTQLTDGPCNNFNACWLPDGGIAFLSDRKPAFAYCFTTTSPILHRMDRDGQTLRRISSSYLNDFTPSVLDDGRIVYSRWEYIDRPAIPIQSLWAMNPDGTGVAGLFGNRAISPGTFMHFMPGEVQSCVGCHADRNYAASRGGSRPTAALRDPLPLPEPEWGRKNFSYSHIVQPVLDQHCIECHNARSTPKGVDLSGDKTDFFNVSYDVLTRKGTGWADHPERHGSGQPVSPYTSWISTANGSESNIREIAPRRWGSPASKVIDLILAGHPDEDGKPRVKMSEREQRRMMAWIDLNIPYYGSVRTNYPKRMGCRRMLPPELDGVLKEVAVRRCASCHDKGNVPRTFYTRVTKPENNNFLLAPLAKAAGGTESCGRAVFASMDDPDYQKILGVFGPINAMLKEKPRMDMAGDEPPCAPTISSL